jgi:hypothetical protein
MGIRRWGVKQLVALVALNRTLHDLARPVRVDLAGLDVSASAPCQNQGGQARAKPGFWRVADD